MNEFELVNAVRRHAMKHYEHGWDVVVECWSDGDILEAIGQARTEQGAIRKVWAEVKPHVDYRAEIQAEAF